MPILKLEVELSDEAFDRAMRILAGDESTDETATKPKRGRAPKAEKPPVEIVEELSPISIEDLASKISYLTGTMDSSGFKAKLPVQELGNVWQELGITDPSLFNTDETLRRKAFDKLSEYDAN